MKLPSLLLAVPLTFAVHPAGAQEPDREKWMAYMLPGDDHAVLQAYEGDWNEDISMWMAPGGEP
ncbi:MAG TPA: hypothetical protein VKG92_09665, partial [Flavobacteriales bacterium]|nr:hypothetical protein [Flavobacteriales bacterium]